MLLDAAFLSHLLVARPMSDGAASQTRNLVFLASDATTKNKVCRCECVCVCVHPQVSYLTRARRMGGGGEGADGKFSRDGGNEKG